MSSRLGAAVIAAAMVAAVPAVDAATTKPPQKKGATYRGISSQGSTACRRGDANDKPCAVIVKVSKAGKKVAQQIFFRADCSDGSRFRSSTSFEGLSISGGKYARSGSYDETIGTQATAKNVVSTHAAFRHKGRKYSVSGDYKLQATLEFTDGSSTRCKTGKVTFKATVK